MSKEIYLVLEEWETLNDSVGQTADAIQELSKHNYAIATLLQSYSSLVEQRLELWQRLQQFGFNSLNQARYAFFNFKED